LRVVVLVVTLVVGTTLVAVTFRQSGDSASFAVTALGAAVVWLVGGLAAGNVRPGSVDGRVPLAGAGALGVAAFAVFAGATVVADHLPWLSDAVETILDKADTGSTAVVLTIAIASAVAEEVFFRGALMGALPAKWAVPGSVVVYAVVTVFTGNPALVVAAAVMGTLFALERRATNGVAAPAITHVVWSVLMIVALPRLG
jgi:CAAX protease family protein